MKQLKYHSTNKQLVKHFTSGKIPFTGVSQVKSPGRFNGSSTTCLHLNACFHSEHVSSYQYYAGRRISRENDWSIPYLFGMRYDDEYYEEDGRENRWLLEPTEEIPCYRPNLAMF